MCAFDLKKSIDEAERRFGSGAASDVPRRRRDAGVSRLHPELLALIESLLLQTERTPVNGLIESAAVFCKARGLRVPSRTTIYGLIDALELPRVSMADLPPAAQRALYNLEPQSAVPGSQVAFACFNYGGLEAMCYAAGLPWLFLYRASKMRGWRPKSRNLLVAAMRARHI